LSSIGQVSGVAPEVPEVPEVAQIATFAALQTDDQTVDQNEILPDLTSSPIERAIKI